MALVSRNHKHGEASTVLSPHMVNLFLFCVDLTTHPVLGHTPSSLGGVFPHSFREGHTENSFSRKGWIPYYPDSWTGSGGGDPC